ncbi:hypothetical protein ARMGADRAFT_100974 [Armillaria gallica]|uniref:Uncharacterized protein n=1 Tax=Armillaria gallica TaxID=47427 RepID=A0A2H3CX13_ARMGA|nr:hypothetical protein ARMGADRAFT_100974 [Armillaria gallica]
MGNIANKKCSRAPDDLPVHDSRHPYAFSLYVCFVSLKVPWKEYGTAFDFVKGVFEGEGVETAVGIDSLSAFTHTKQNHAPMPLNLRFLLRCHIHLALDLPWIVVSHYQRIHGRQKKTRRES